MSRRIPLRCIRAMLAARLKGADLFSRFDQQVEIHGLSHSLVAGIAGMQMVTGIIVGPDITGLGRILEHLIEVDHGVECATGADPLVDSLPDLLLLGRVVAFERSAFEGFCKGRERRPQNTTEPDCPKSHD